MPDSFGSSDDFLMGFSLMSILHAVAKPLVHCYIYISLEQLKKTFHGCGMPQEMSCAGETTGQSILHRHTLSWPSIPPLCQIEDLKYFETWFTHILDQSLHEQDWETHRCFLHAPRLCSKNRRTISLGIGGTRIHHAITN